MFLYVTPPLSSSPSSSSSSSSSSAGPKYEYHWADGQTVKKPIKCSAPKYIDYLMTWAQDQLDDETTFPSKIGEMVVGVSVVYSLIMIKSNLVTLILPKK